MASAAALERSDLECAICLELLLDPLRLECSHAFCRSCSSLAFRRLRSCPVCRCPLPEDFNPEVARVNSELQTVLQRKCTVEYNQRVEDAASAAAKLVRIRIGNGLEFLGLRNMRPTFQWTLRVDLEPSEESALPSDAALPDLVESVRFGLRPACRVISVGTTVRTQEEQQQPAPSFVEVSRGPFELTATSWLSFSVPVIIKWKGWVGQPPLRLEHDLDFQRDGGHWSYGVELASQFVGSEVGLWAASEPAVQPCLERNEEYVYLPFQIEDCTVLHHEQADRYSYNALTLGNEKAMRYRISKNMDDKHSTASLPHGATVAGAVEETEGGIKWLKVKQPKRAEKVKSFGCGTVSLRVPAALRRIGRAWKRFAQE